MEKLTDSGLARIVNHRPTDDPVAKGVEQNREFAAECLASIFSLRSNPAYLWFERECLQAITKQAEAKLKDPDSPEEDLRVDKQKFLLAKRFRDWMDDREATYRATLDESDPVIGDLRRKISLQ